MDQRPSEWADERIERASAIYADHGKVFHAAWIVAAVVVVIAGLAMSVLPGPATLVIPIGLAMLAVVFGSARHLLIRSLEVGDRASRRARDASTPVKVVSVAAAVCAVAAVAVVVWVVV